MVSEGSPVAVFLAVLEVFVVLFVFAGLEEDVAFPDFPVEEGTAVPLSVVDPPEGEISWWLPGSFASSSSRAPR